MSLINQMLKDLEARRQQEGNVSPQTASVTPCHSPKRRRMISLPVLISLLVILGIGLVAAGWWWQRQKLPQQAVPIVSASSPVSQPSESSLLLAPVAVVSPVQKTVVDVEPSVAPIALQMVEIIAPQAEIPLQNQLPKPVIDVMETMTPVLSTAGAIESAPSKPVAGEAVVKEPAAVVVKPPSSPLAQAQQLRVQAQRLVTQRRYAAAAILYEQALQLDASSPVLWHQLAVIYLRTQQLDEALRVADSGCQLYQNDPSLRVVQARLLVELGKKDQALAALQSITLPLVKTSSDYYALLATLQQQAGDLVDAEKNYALLTTVFPQRGDWWLGRAICADRLGQRQQATRYFKQALGSRQLKPKLKQYALQQLARLQG